MATTTVNTPGLDVGSTLRQWTVTRGNRRVWVLIRWAQRPDGGYWHAEVTTDETARRGNRCLIAAEYCEGLDRGYPVLGHPDDAAAIAAYETIEMAAQEAATYILEDRSGRWF